MITLENKKYYWRLLYMSRKPYRLTTKEEELMNLLWKQDKPMTSVEILAIGDEHSWSDNYLPIMLKSLLKKKPSKCAAMHSAAHSTHGSSGIYSPVKSTSHVSPSAAAWRHTRFPKLPLRWWKSLARIRTTSSGN